MRLAQETRDEYGVFLDSRASSSIQTIQFFRAGESGAILWAAQVKFRAKSLKAFAN